MMHVVPTTTTIPDASVPPSPGQGLLDLFNSRRGELGVIPTHFDREKVVNISIRGSNYYMTEIERHAMRRTVSFYRTLSDYKRLALDLLVVFLGALEEAEGRNEEEHYLSYHQAMLDDVVGMARLRQTELAYVQSMRELEDTVAKLLQRSAEDTVYDLIRAIQIRTRKLPYDWVREQMATELKEKYGKYLAPLEGEERKPSKPSFLYDDCSDPPEWQEKYRI